jgi:hypothetical protein
MTQMTHLNQDELTSEALGEGSGREHAHRLAHLGQCSACSGELAALLEDMTAAAALMDGGLSERDERWAEDLWLRLRPHLEPYPQRRGSRLFVGLWPRLGWAAAAVALLAVSFAAGRIWEQRQRPAVVVNLSAPPAAPAAPVLAQAQVSTKTPAVSPQSAPRPVVVVVLADHLDRSERLLVQLKHADLDTNETAPALRAEARSLLEENRVARQRAQTQGDPALRNALDQLNTLLDQMANRSDGLTAADLVRLRDEMNAAGLLFEVRVLRSRIPGGKAATGSPAHGGTV